MSAIFCAPKRLQWIEPAFKMKLSHRDKENPEYSSEFVPNIEQIQETVLNQILTSFKIVDLDNLR